MQLLCVRGVLILATFLLLSWLPMAELSACPFSGTWNFHPPVPGDTGLVLTSMAVIGMNSKLYVIGGQLGVTPQKSVLVLDPTTDVWTSAAPAPTGIQDTGITSSEGLIYIFGLRVPQASNPGKVYPNAYVYNPESNIWKTLPSMPTARCGAAAAALNGVIYVIGGNNLIPGELLNVVEGYFPHNNTWKSFNPFPYQIGYATAFNVNGTIYLTGGSLIRGALEWDSGIYAYYPLADNWTMVSYPPKYAEASVFASLGQTLYVIGGEPGGIVKEFKHFLLQTRLGLLRHPFPSSINLKKLRPLLEILSFRSTGI